MLTVPWLVTHTVQKIAASREQTVVTSTGTTEQQQQVIQQREEQIKVTEPTLQAKHSEIVQHPKQPEGVQPPPQPKQPEVKQPIKVPDIQQKQEQEQPKEEKEKQISPQAIQPTKIPVLQAATQQNTNGLDGSSSQQISKKSLTLTPSITGNRMSEAWANQQVEKFQFSFEQADKDKSGALSFAEVYAVLKDNGFKGSETEAHFIFSHLDKNKDQTISKDEFSGAMKNMPKMSMKEFALRKAFLTLDVDASGFLTGKEIQDGITMKAGLDLTENNFSDLLIYLCKEDKDKKVSYEEFLYVFGVEATAVELRRIFITLDADGSGKLSRDEILAAVKADFELKLKADQISDLLIKYSQKYKATDKSITYDEFVEVWLKQKKEKK